MKSRARSFRDPAGRLHFVGDSPVRQVYAEAADECRALVGGEFFQGMMKNGEVVRTRVLDKAPGELATVTRPGELILAHESIPFPSFPAEWCGEMLKAAALLTLEMAERGLARGVGLKDATPYNVLFKGSRPVFVDVLSFEKRDPLDPVWLAQGQFMRTFLLPLLAASHLGLPLSTLFLVRRDGMEPEQLYRMLGPLDRIRPRFLSPVSLPVWLSGRAEREAASVYRPRRSKSGEQAEFVLRTQLKGLRRQVERSWRPPARSTWSDYETSCSYEKDAFDQKSSFVEEFLRRTRPGRVLDVGCNSGHFSRLAAEAGSEVVALDQDPVVVEALYRKSAERGMNILPLVVDVARPTPAAGWNNEETPSFLARARGRFDAVFMLALVHHLVVTGQIPLDEVLALAARITNRHLVIEYVPPEDPQFKRLTRGRDSLYRQLTREHFERTAAQHFTIRERTKVIDQERWLYVMEKNPLV
ncbi:class I SAM-dependent methyltransferase [Geomonas sp. Red32]|uniref:class I SAM-dependent methyltransferase n=1 Tax=Geomonas sp. Red32 TaxID=2912856 RepID=UPI00202CF6F9|nr:class I SAM-dependent methyltransferase [Geomonas sp. Red32]MCM0083729.1 class I SAM-dependent methyltransferase [Geomonas sp. Red32]